MSAGRPAAAEQRRDVRSEVVGMTMRTFTGPARVGDIVFLEGVGEHYLVGRVVAANHVEILATELPRVDAKHLACKHADAATIVFEIFREHPDGDWNDSNRRGGLDQA